MPHRRDRRKLLPYAKVLDRNDFGSFARLDGRTLLARAIRGLTAELVELIGGSPTVAERLLIERIVKMKLQLDALDVKLEKGCWTPHDSRTYAGLGNAYRLALRELQYNSGAGKQKRAPSLGEVVTAFRQPG